MVAPKAYIPHLLEAAPQPGDATQKTLDLLLRAAPEQGEELKKVVEAGVQARLSTGGSTPEIAVTFNALLIPEEVLKQFWLLAHAAWQDFSNFQDRKDGTCNLDGESAVQKALPAAKVMTEGGVPDWPPQAPHFMEVRDGAEAKAIREIYGIACAWTILHEVKHAIFFEDPERPEDKLLEERICDQYASTLLFSKVSDYSRLTGESADMVMDKRAIGSLVGLYFIARLSVEGVPSVSHPPVQERIKLLFDLIGTGPLKHFWDFALALICELKPEINTKPVPLENPTSRDLAYLALGFAFPGQPSA